MDDANADLAHPSIIPSGTRRAVLGLTASGLAHATGGLLLPTRLAGAAEQPVSGENRARRRRRRRRHQHRHQHIKALAVLALKLPLTMPQGQLTTIALDQGMPLIYFNTTPGSVRPTLPETATYHMELAMTWSWDGSSGAQCLAGFRVTNSDGDVTDYTNQTVMIEPTTFVLVTQDLLLEPGNVIEVIGQWTANQDAGAQAQVVASTLSIYVFD